jgi:hypothetical protein
MTKDIKIGIRISPRPRLEFFGLEELNALIAKGGNVASISQGDAILTKVGEGGGEVRMVLSGCDMLATVDLPYREVGNPRTP